MGTPDNHGPPEGSGAQDGIPGLPPDWGRVVIPDDASALAEEAALLRRELRAQAQTRPGRLPNRQPGRLHGTGPDGPDPRPSARLPLLVIVLAVLATVAGLFALTWPRPARPAGRPTVVPAVTPSPEPGRTLPALELTDQRQTPVSLRGLLPAVIFLVDGCDCPDQITGAAAVAPDGVTVVTVVSDGSVPARAPPGPTPGAPVRPLADPAGGLRAFLGLPPRPGTATAVLVDHTGTVVRVVAEVHSVEDYRTDLARLAQR